MKIQFYKRYQPENQLKLVEDALISGNLSSDGNFITSLRENFKMNLAVKNILFTTSATTALELAVQLIDLKPGDQVILPSYNFPSAANAVLKAGGTPVLCDVDLSTKNIDLTSVEEKITNRTKAIIPTHYAGISCDMSLLMELAKKNHIKVIEDAAQAVLSFFKNVPLGTIGDFGAYSFHHTKNFSCGEGGAFICNDASFLEDAEIIRDNGTNKAQFLRNELDNYSWQKAGSNYILSEACAALLYAQMLASEIILSKRKGIADTYTNVFRNSSHLINEMFTLMEIPDYSTPNYHIYYIDCLNPCVRETLRKELLTEGIDARSHFIPLHTSDFGRAMGYETKDFPNSMKVSETILRLPLHTEMTVEDAAAIGDIIIQKVKAL
ncbi:MAG: dTDP-4-amino-4,6-dideoxygalactose transaminase [Peptostreptococcaceae bacterium]|nr:dTDP-4-amino-4,6-dideoxygalactose transaminase [Peptostreptococcaceae bacterium]